MLNIDQSRESGFKRLLQSGGAKVPFLFIQSFLIKVLVKIVKVLQEISIFSFFVANFFLQLYPV